MLSLRLFGGLALEADGAPLALPARAPGRLLLGYLALHPGLHPRASLAAVLWPDVLATSARSSLRSALASVRRSFDAVPHSYLIAVEDRIGLGPPEAIEVDALRMRALAGRGELEAAAGLARGELLDGLDADWIWDAREEHQVLLDGVLNDLARLREQSGDLPGAIATARRRVSLDPLAEPGARELMRLLDAAGDRAGALGVYWRLQERFRRELRAVPSDATRTLAERIRVSISPPSADDDEQLPLPAALAGPASVPYVGRGDSLTLVRMALERAESGVPQLIVVSGEPGIGKTRLLGELGRSAHAELGASVLLGRCPHQPAIPYQPFVEAISQYAGAAAPSRLAREVPAIAGELGELVPALGERCPGLPQPLGEGAGELDRVLQALLSVALAASRDRPLVLLIDDFHLADAPTARLFEHLVASAGGTRLLVAVAYVETAAGPAARSAVARTRRLPATTQLRLEGLDERAVRELMTAAGSGARPSPGAARDLRRRTGGNPLLVNALLDRRGPETAGDGALPDLIGDVLGAEVEQLAPLARTMLAAAAAAGDTFELELVARLSDVTLGAALDGLDAAVGAGVIRELPERPGLYEFRHPLLRETVYAGLTATRRAYLHARVGRALGELPAAGGQPPLRLVAGQLELARELAQPAEVVGALSAAAGQATRQRCHEDAADLYERAVEVATRRDPGDRARRCELLLELGHARRRAGRSDTVREAFEQAAAEARVLADPSLLARAALGICSVPFFPGGEDVDRLAVDLLGEALAGLAGDDLATRSRLNGRLARELYFSGDRATTMRLADEAVALGRRSGDPSALGEALDALHLQLAGSGDAHRRLAVADELVGLGERHHDLELLTRGRTRRAVDLLERGDLAGLAGERTALGQLADDMGQPAYHWWAEIWNATEAILCGDLDTGRRAARAAFERGHAAFGEAAELEFQVQLTWASWAEGRLGDVDDAVRAVAAHTGVIPALRCTAALIAAERGRRSEAVALIEELTGPELGRLRNDSGWLVSGVLLAEACAATGQRAAAMRLREPLEPFADLWAVSGWGSVCLSPVARALALIAATTGDHDEAARRFDASSAAAEAIGATRLGARIERERARRPAA